MAFVPRTQPFQFSSSGENSTGLFEDVSTRSLQNVRVGGEAGKVITGAGNTVVGYESGRNMKDSDNTTCVGYRSGYDSTVSVNNTMVGALSGAHNNHGSELVFVGFKSGEFAQFAGQCVGVGANTLNECVSGQAVVAVGYRAGERSLDGSFNTMVGTESGQENRSGNFNTMTGYRSGRVSFLGNENTYIGAFSGYSNTHGSANCFMGFKSGYAIENGNYNVAIGAYSLQNASSASCNVVIGPFAGSNQSGLSRRNVVIGTNVATNGTGISDSVIIGSAAAPSISGSGSVILGAGTASTCRYGNCNILIGVGADTIIASNSYGIAIGNKDTLVCNNSISIGDYIANNRDNSVMIGYRLDADATNSVIMGNDISIESVKALKDPLYYPFIPVVLDDGKRKFGVTEITYDNTLISPCNSIYNNAVFSVFSRNTVSSITNPETLDIGTGSFNLLNAVDKYGLTMGSVTVVSESNYNTNSNVTSYTSTNVTSTPFSSNVHLSDFLYTHTFQNVATFSQPVTLNIRNFGKDTTSIQHHFVKTVSEPSIISYTSNFNASRLASTTVNVAAVLCNVATFLDNTTEVIHNTAPKYGRVSNMSYTLYPDMSYTLYPDAMLAESDQFTILPVTSVSDSLSNIYGITSSNSEKQVTLNFGPKLEYVPDSIYFEQKSYSFSSCNFINISDNTPVRFTFIDSGMTIRSNSSVYSALDISTMESESIQMYPDSMYTTYIDAIKGGIEEAIQDNLDTLLDINYNIQEYIVNLATAPIDANSVYSLSNYAAATLDIQVSSLSNLEQVHSSFNVLEYQNSVFACNVEPLTTNLRTWKDGFSNVYQDWVAYYQVEAALDMPPNNAKIALASIANTSLPVATARSEYNTIYHKYFEVPRLFLTRSNIQDVSVQYTDTLDDINIVVGDTPYTLHSYSSSKEPLWSTFGSNVSYTITANAFEISPFTSSHTLYVSKTPQHGILDSDAKYHLYNPWFEEDFCGFVAASNTKSIDLDVNIIAHSNTVIQPVNTYTTLETSGVTSAVFSPISTTSNVTPVWNIQTVNGISFSNAISMYDPAVGYYIATSNVLTSNSTLLTIGNGSNFITSNIVYNESLYSSLVGSITTTKTSNVTPQVYSGSNFSSSNSYTTLWQAISATQSNFYPTGSITQQYSQSNIATDYFNVNTGLYVYRDSNTVTTPTLRYSLASINTPTSNGILDVVINGTMNAQCNVYMNLHSVTKRNIFNVRSNVYTEYSNATAFDVIIKDIGAIPSKSFTQSQLTSNIVYIRPTTVPPFSSQSITIHPSVSSLPITTSRLVNVDPVTHQVQLDSLFESDVSSLSFTPFMIYIYSVEHGAVLLNGSLSTVISYTARNTSSYLATGYYRSDKLVYFYTSASGTPSALFTKQLTINMGPNPAIQDINVGLPRYTDNILNLQSSFTNSTIELVDVSSDISLQNVATNNILRAGDSFNVSDAVEIYPAASGTIVYNVLLNNTTVLSSKVHSVNVYEHYAYSLNSAVSELDIRFIGDGPWRVSTKGNAWDELLSTVHASNVDVAIVSAPRNGFLWKQGRKICSYISVADLASLRYISYNPDIIQNDTCTFKFIYNGAQSPLYTAKINNYISRFNNTYINTRENSRLYPPVRSAGMIIDGIEWTPTYHDINVMNLTGTSNITWNILGNQYIQSVQYHSVTEPVTLKSISSERTIDEADSFHLSSLMLTDTPDVVYFVATNPREGIIYNTATSNTVSSFRLSDPVIYQHLGKNTTTDTFTLGLATTPYNYSKQQHIVTVNVTEMPRVTQNKVKYFFYNSLVDAAASSNVFDTFTTSKQCSIHVLDTNVIPLRQTFDTSNVAFTLTPQFLSSSTFPSITANVATNNHEGVYVNPLAQLPQYRDLFIHTLEGYVNKYTNSNEILYNLSDTQSIQYTFDNVATLTKKTVTVTFDMKVDYIVPQISSYRLTTAFGARTVDVTAPVSNGTWNAVSITNHDPTNSDLLSVYINDILVNTTSNIDDYTDITVSVPISHSSNYIGSSNFVRNTNGVSFSFDLFNYHNKINLRNLKLLVSAYGTDDVATNADIHNVVTGKQITVQGLNNICIGNRFKTSGQNSIIIGNSIGTAGTSVANVNDIYESIVIGNNSYSNSIVRDIISIGNNILPDLSLAVTSNVQNFLAQKPIVIGNDITNTKLDFHVNIGNSFMKTHVNGKQIYLGNDHETVAIGFTSNVGADGTMDLVVARGIQASTVSAVMTIVCISVVPISTYKLVSSTGMYTDSGELIVQASAVSMDINLVGVCLQCQQVAPDTWRVIVATSGHTKVYCNTAVTMGQFLTSSSNGYACPTSNTNAAFGKALVSWNPSTEPPKWISVNSDNAALIGCLIRLT